MELAPCVIFPAFLALVAALIVYSILKGRRRREAFARLATEMGVFYYPRDPRGLPARYGMFDLFGHGHSKKASNVLVSQEGGREAVAFDYQYTTGSGKNRTTHYHQAAVLGLPIDAVRLRIRSENILDRVASWVGWDDIDFESDEFSRRYHVKCDDRRFAYDIFHARLIEHLLGCAEAPNLELNGPVMLLYERRGEVERARRLIQIGRDIVQSIPDYVLKARGIGHAAGDRT